MLTMKKAVTSYYYYENSFKFAVCLKESERFSGSQNTFGIMGGEVVLKFN